MNNKTGKKKKMSSGTCVVSVVFNTRVVHHSLTVI